MDELRAFVKTGARILMQTAMMADVLRLVEADPHLWTRQPCQTCCTVSDIIGRPFGCVATEARRG